ncbi:hypothetical protein N44_00989 [Microcystis aeruginosa NIES-44]|uniref:Uncharacterized protein n=1 Tax=Microcystis aeruginosa NIES-44 TaxID=449439 RepID=A0A0A1VT32_MICAE|nr:hypothetical protein N44_00989 [Microcystis aeruginosa NIES-44]
MNYPYGIIPTELSLRNYPYDLNCCYGDYKSFLPKFCQN